MRADIDDRAHFVRIRPDRIDVFKAVVANDDIGRPVPFAPEIQSVAGFNLWYSWRLVPYDFVVGYFSSTPKVPVPRSQLE